MTDPLEPLSTDPSDLIFIDVETRSTEDVTVHGSAGERAVLPSDLHILLSACFESGSLTWRPRNGGVRVAGRTLTSHGANIFNGKFLRLPVGSVGLNGYLQLGFLGCDLLAHRVLWAMRFGVWPKNKVDHINGIRTDNRAENLRLVDNTQHCRNMARPKNNTSGRVGVRQAPNGRWRAYISLGNRQQHLGCYDNFDEAVRARERAEMTHGFHENHGRDPHERS